MMRKLKLIKRLLTVVSFTLILMGCSNNEPVEDIQQVQDTSEIAKSAEIDEATAIMDDIAIDAFEVQEASETGRSTQNETYSLPDCVTITVVVSLNSREVTIDFGEGCEVRGHTLKGKIILSYNRDPEAQQITISKSLEDFYFDDKHIEGGKTIVKQRENDNGNPQFTKTVDITVTWPDATEASRVGTKIREWIEGHGSGVWSDNVFEVTGNWTTSFRNGNTHSYVVTTPLRREVICRFFVSGTIDVERTNFSGVFDFGEGDCDNQATFTFSDGTVEEIILQ